MTRNLGKLLRSTAAIALVAGSWGAVAQAQDNDEEQARENGAAADGEETENVIIVSGIRGSILESVNDKRRSGQIVDTINAEDIGKSTDQNIAEALNRVSGVSINTNNGEGTTISVRGANADQTVVTLNGTSLGSTGFSQGVDLSSYSADILAKVEVVKTPSADDEEGSLAAVVNLITRKPLDIVEDVRTITVQGRYNDLSENTDYKVSGTFSQKFLNDTVGVILTVYDETNSVRRDQAFFENYDVYGSNLYTDQNGNAFGAQPALNAENFAATTLGRPSVFDGVQGVAAATPYTNIGFGIAPGTAGYELQQNDLSRRGIDMSLQWEPSDRTSITINGTYAKQKFDNRMDGVFVSTTRFFGHIDGTNQPNLFLGEPFADRSGGLFLNDSRGIVGIYDANPIEYGGTVQNFGDPVTNPTLNDKLQWTDPVQLWRTLDTDTNTWTQFQSRHAVGGTRASINRFENENFLIGAEIEQRFGDNLLLTAGGSYSKSEQTPDRSVFLVSNRNRTVGPWNLHHVPADILVPAGYDCSGGGACQLIGGDTTPFLGSVIEFRADQNDLWDNVGRTGFNPDDLASHTLAFISSGFTSVEDEQTTAYADLDWEVEFAGITSFEFGAKYTDRSKNVDSQTGTPRPGQDLVEAISPFTGETIFVNPSAINLISAAIFSSGPLAASNFGQGIGLSRDNITDGWQTFDPVAALEAVTTGDRDFTLDRTQTRGAEFSNLAAYAKANFEYLEGRLRGDVGLRYVRTKVDTTGFAGAQFAFDQQGRGRVIDPIYLAQLRNSNQANPCPVLAETPSPLGIGPSSQFWTGNAGNGNVNDPNNYNLTAFAERNRQARIDGQGTSPAVPGGLCYDPLLERGALPGTFLERNLIRYADLSTEQFGTIGGNALPDRSRASIAAADSFSYNVWLPNLNLSFLASDEFIMRFSAYKTMSRPPIDDLRAGFRLNEGNIFEGNPVFRPSSTLDLFSAKIRPLTAWNLDAAVEWYFDREGLLSANVFYKDISNLIETADSRFFLGDLRRIAADPDGATVEGTTFTDAGGTTTELLLAPSNGGAQPDIGQCFPRRLQGEATLGTAQDWLFSDDASLLCNEFNVSRRQNAGKASVEGIELQYVHNYRFLPGPLSGLGVAANYTFQNGEFSDSGFPIPGTPRHSYNITGFWQDGGHQLRLAYSGNSDSLIQRSFGGGALWQEGRQTLDFSAAYQLSSNIAFTFEAQNLTDAPVRTYFTSRILRLPDATGTIVEFDEGSIRDGAYKGRTVQEYNTGTIFRAGVRVEF